MKTVHLGIWNQFCPILSPTEWNGSSMHTHHALLLASIMFFHEPSYRTLLISPLWKRSPQEVKLRSMCKSCSSPCGRTWGRREKKRMKLAGQERQRREREKSQAITTLAFWSIFNSSFGCFSFHPIKTTLPKLVWSGFLSLEIRSSDQLKSLPKSSH